MCSYAAIPGNVFLQFTGLDIYYCCFYIVAFIKQGNLESGKQVHYSVFLTTYNQTVFVLVWVLSSLAINQCSCLHTCIKELFVSLSDLKELIVSIVSMYSCRKWRFGLDVITWDNWICIFVITVLNQSLCIFHLIYNLLLFM